MGNLESCLEPFLMWIENFMHVDTLGSSYWLGCPWQIFLFPSRESTNSILLLKLKIDLDQIITRTTLVKLFFDYDVIIKSSKFWPVTWLDNLSDVKFWKLIFIGLCINVTLEWIAILRANATRFAPGDKFSILRKEKVYFSQSPHSTLNTDCGLDTTSLSVKVGQKWCLFVTWNSKILENFKNLSAWSLKSKSCDHQWLLFWQ